MKSKFIHISVEWLDALLRLAFLTYMIMGVCQFLAPVDYELTDNCPYELIDSTGEQESDSDEVNKQPGDDLVELDHPLYVHLESQLKMHGLIPSFTSEYRDVFTPPPEA